MADKFNMDEKFLRKKILDIQNFEINKKINEKEMKKIVNDLYKVFYEILDKDHEFYKQIVQEGLKSKNGLLNIILFEGKRLIFSNIFDYSCKEDVLYYILFVVDNVKNVNEGSEICIISKKEDMDDEINYLSKFIKNLKIIDENILE